MQVMQSKPVGVFTFTRIFKMHLWSKFIQFDDFKTISILIVMYIHQHLNGQKNLSNIFFFTNYKVRLKKNLLNIDIFSFYLIKSDINFWMNCIYFLPNIHSIINNCITILFLFHSLSLFLSISLSLTYSIVL